MLENYWYIAELSHSLRRKPIAVTLFNKHLVLFRDSQGRVAALEDRCPHRSAPLSRGGVVQGQIQCPYHGWCFDADGFLVDIPYAFHHHKPKQAAVKSYPCCEQQGYIWVSTGRPKKGVLPYYFPHLTTPGWLSFRMDTLFQGPVEACLENFLDCPHAAQVHKFWFRAPASKPVAATLRTLEDGAIVHYFSEPREQSVVWWLLAPRSGEMQHTDQFIAPATSCVSYHFSARHAYIISSSCTPINDHSTRVHTVISFRFGRITRLIYPFFKRLSQLIIQQDVRMLQQQQANIKRFGSMHCTVIEQDLLFTPIQQWRKALQTGQAPPLAGQETQVQMRL